MGASGESPRYPAARHVPRITLEWMADAPHERWRVVDGTLLFADISGFTALSERLAGRGRIGAEELVETLSEVFGSVLAVAARRGGHLLKFGGDALLFLFPDGDHVVDACSTAAEIRHELRRASATPTAVGRIHLAASVGVHTGACHLFLVGDTHRELVVAGPAVSEVLRCEGLASGGEVVVSEATAAVLSAQDTRRRTDGVAVLRWRSSRSGRDESPRSRAPWEHVARDLLPSMLHDEFAGTRPDPAHRNATIAFLRFGGLDRRVVDDGADATAEVLDRILAVAQSAFEADDVALLAVDCDRDAIKLFCSSGVPTTSEDDEGRMLRAARRILDADLPISPQIGVNRGHVFAAEVGNPERAAFSAMGDTTNLAARICARTPPGALYAHPAVLEHARTLHESSPVGPFEFKGKAQPQLLYAVGDEIGVREASRDDLAPLVGRDDDVELVRRRLGDLAEGTGSSLTVSGPVGVGKSRLVDAALETVPGLAVLGLHAEPYGSRSPYRMFRDPVRTMLGVERGPQEQMAEALRRAARRSMEAESIPYLALLADVAQIDVEPSREVSDLLPRHRPDRTADLVVDLVARCHDGPLVIRVEDAHWSDDASRHLIRRLTAETSRRPWFVLVVERSDGGDVPDPDRLELAPLAADDVRRIALHLTEAAPRRPHEIERLVDRAGGNPLFLHELLRATGGDRGDDAVPESLQGAMAAQVDALDPFARRVLSYASVLGRSFRRSVFREALRQEEIEVDPATYGRLRELIEPDGPDRWRFGNGLLRDVVYEGMGFRLRRRLHLHVADAIENLSTDREAEADTLALHCARAGDARRTLAYASIAGDRAARAQANADAAGFFEQALDAARRLGDVDVAERYRLWVALGEARERSGMLDGALAAYRSAAALRRDDPVRQAEIRLRRARVHESAGSYARALAETSRVRNALAHVAGAECGSLRARAAAFACTIRVHQERPADVLRLTEVATAEAERWSDRSALARATSARAWACMVTGRPDGAAAARRALELYREVGDLAGQAHMENNLGVEAYFRGDWDETLRRYERASVACRRAGDLVNAALTDANTGEVLVNQGRLEEAEAVLRDAVRTLRALSSPANAAFAEMHLGRAMAATGRFVEAERLLRRVVATYGELGAESAHEANLHLAHCLVTAGRPQEAVEVVEGSRVAARDEMRIFAAAEALVTAEALVALGRASEAGERIVEGVAAARSSGLDHDLAQLLDLAVRTGVASASDLGSDDPAAEAAGLFSRLGVVRPEP